MNSLKEYSYIELLSIGFTIIVVAAIVYNAAIGNAKENGCRDGQSSISGYSGGHYIHLCVDQGAQSPVIIGGH